MILAHAVIELLFPLPIQLAELRILVALGIPLFVLPPQKIQGEIELSVTLEFVVDIVEIGQGPGTGARNRNLGEKPLFELSILQRLGLYPADACLLGTPEILRYGAACDLTAVGNLAPTKSAVILEAQDFFDFPHR